MDSLFLSLVAQGRMFNPLSEELRTSEYDGAYLHVFYSLLSPTTF